MEVVHPTGEQLYHQSGQLWAFIFIPKLDANSFLSLPFSSVYLFPDLLRDPWGEGIKDMCKYSSGECAAFLSPGLPASWGARLC